MLLLMIETALVTFVIVGITAIGILRIEYYFEMAGDKHVHEGRTTSNEQVLRRPESRTRRTRTDRT